MLQARNQESVKVPQFDIAVPVHLKSQQKPKGQSIVHVDIVASFFVLMCRLCIKFTEAHILKHTSVVIFTIKRSLQPRPTSLQTKYTGAIVIFEMEAFSVMA